MTCCCHVTLYWILVGSLTVAGKAVNWGGGDGPAVRFVSMGKIGFVRSLSVLKKGGVPEANPAYAWGSMRSWKIPNPDRKTVVPLPLSPQATPTRGWKSFFVMAH